MAFSLLNILETYFQVISIALLRCVHAAAEPCASDHLQLSSCVASAAPAKGSRWSPTPWVGAKGAAGAGWLLASNAEFGSAHSSARPRRG